MKLVLNHPVISEKSTTANELHKYIFNVNVTADKASVKKAVEELFKVKVVKINMVRIQGKMKTFRRSTGRRSDVKKAIVTLKKGDTIALFEGAKS